MDESILTSIKKLRGVTEEYTHFDPDIIRHINNAFVTLNRLGVGPAKGFRIHDVYAVWTDFIPDNDLLLDACVTYIDRKVHLAFDPPTNSSHLNSLKELIKEDEWRILEIVETPGSEVES